MLILLIISSLFAQSKVATEFHCVRSLLELLFQLVMDVSMVFIVFLISLCGLVGKK